MSVYSAYYTCQKAHARSPVESKSMYTPINIAKSDQKQKESLYNSTIMSRAIAESQRKQRELRNNSPTFKLTDTINQANYDMPIHKSSLKKAVFSGAESMVDPVRNFHSSHNSSNDKLTMFRQDHYLKKQNLSKRVESAQKDWKSSIRCYKQEERQYKPERRVRKQVELGSPKRDPIVSPNSKENKRLLKGCKKQPPQQWSIESKKIYQFANSSTGFVDTFQQSINNSTRNVRNSATFQSEVKGLLQTSNVDQKFHRSDYKGSDNIKKSKRYSIKVDIPRPISAFML